MTTAPLEIRVIPIETLAPAPYNPRLELQLGSAAWRKLEASLREFGLVEPLIWNESTGYVVGGHARLRILKEMGVAEIPVSVVRLSVEREKALNIVLNNREAQGRYDPEKLADLLTGLQETPELEFTGFEESDVAALRLEPVQCTTTELGEDSVEITLTMDEATFGRCSPRLDKLIGDFDLQSHVKRK